MRRLGHAISFDQRRAEGRFEFRDDLRRHRRRGRSEEAQRIGGDDVLVLRGAREDRLMHRWHRRVPGRPGLTYPAEEFQRVETGRAEHGAAARKRREQSRDQSMDMKQRHDIQAAIDRRKLQRLGDIACRGADIALRERNDLGP